MSYIINKNSINCEIVEFKYFVNLDFYYEIDIGPYYNLRTKR